MRTRIVPTLPAAVLLSSAVLAGGYYESTYSLLAAAVWLGIAVAASVAPAPRPSVAVWALAALTVLSLVSALWGRPEEAYRAAPLAALYTGVLYAAEWVASPLMLAALRWSVVGVAAAAIAARALGLASAEAGQGSQRLAWPVTYANGLGLVCALGVVLCAGARSRVGAAICAVALVWTFSRSAIVGCAGGLVLLAALRGLVPRRLAFGTAVALLVVAAVLAKPIADRFATPAPDARNAERLVDVSGHGRTTLWQLAWTEGREHPLAGGGAGSWARFAAAHERRSNLPANAHSLELETFAELGVLGVLALGAFLVAVGRARGDTAALAAFAVWAVVSATDWDWQLPAATIPAMVCAGALTRGPGRLGSRAGLALAAVALAVGATCAWHGLGT